MRAWSTLFTLVAIAYWIAGKLGYRPEVPEHLVVDLMLFPVAFMLTVAHLYWHRLRAAQTAAGFVIIALAPTGFVLLAFLHEIGVIPWRAYNTWFLRLFLGCVLIVVAAVILLVVDRIGHPRRWKLVAQHAANCSFFDSLLLRDIPDLTEHEDVGF